MKLTAVVLTFCLLITATALHAADSDFRNASWGMTKEQVKKVEPGKPSEEKARALVYEDKLLGRDYRVGYGFVDGELFLGGYALAEEHLSGHHYLNAYDDLHAALVKKYGPPDTIKDEYINDFYRNDRNAMSLGIFSGNVTKHSVWIRGDTKIETSLYPLKGKVSCEVQYTSISRSARFEELEKKAAQNEQDKL